MSDAARPSHTDGSTPEALHPNAVAVRDAAAALGLAVTVARFPEGTRTAEDAAAAIGCDVAQIVKSLVFLVEGSPTMALVSGANQLDEAKLSRAAGGGKVKRANADQVRAATGFAIGGVPPFGHLTPLRVFIDPDLLQYDEVWAAAGTAHDVFGVEPHELAEASGGLVVDLKRTA